MFFNALLACALLVTGAAAVPAAKRQDTALPLSAEIKVVSTSGEAFLIHDGRVYSPAAASIPGLPSIPRPETPSLPSIPEPEVPGAPLRARSVPVPHGLFTIVPVAGSDASTGDVLVTLTSFDAPCVLRGETAVLACFDVTDSGEPTAVFRAVRHEDTGAWELLGGSPSFTFDETAEGDSKDLSPLLAFASPAQLFLN